MLPAIFGTVLVLFSLVALFVGADAWLFWGHLVFGLGLLGYAATSGYGELRELLQRDSGQRGIRQGSNAVVQAVLLAVILGLVAYMANRYSVTWDWTEGSVHTLAEGTKDVLKQIDDDRQVEIYAFFTRGAQSGARGLLDKYVYESDQLSYELIDATERPDLATRFDVNRDGVLMVCSGTCDGPEGSARVEQMSEQELTKAIRSVISEQRKIYFLSGHGEGDVSDEQETGYARAKLALTDENYVVEPLLLANLPDVPDDADAVVVAGPTYSVLPRETEALDRYVRGGGAVLMMVDPLVVSGLEDVVREWGVELGNDVIVDQQIQLLGGPKLGVQPIVADFGAHPVTERMGAQATLFQVARSLQAAGESGALGLAFTSERSWAETDLEQFTQEGRVGLDEAADRRGPIEIAMVQTFEVENEDGTPNPDAREGRLIVVGDADFARNRYIHTLANADLFLNMISWLAGQEEFITIERKLPRASRAALTPGQYSTFLYLSIFVLPELILLAGIWNWWQRRS